MKTNKLKSKTLVPTLSIKSEEKGRCSWFDCEKI